jgi:hypothetical protein
MPMGVRWVRRSSIDRLLSPSIATDPVAGPRLIIGEYGSRRVRCLTLRTGVVSTLAGSSDSAKGIVHTDGPASMAAFYSVYDVAVGCNGAVLVVDHNTHCVRRISPAPASGSAERMVTTLIGALPATGSRVEYAHSSHESFRKPLSAPWAMALFINDADAPDGARDTDRDVGRLFVGCLDGVHACDLAKGERKFFALSASPYGIAGMAVTEDGARLFAVIKDGVRTVDLRTGACAVLVPTNSGSQFRAGPVPAGGGKSGRFAYVMGCVIDKATRSLLMVEYQTHQIVRLRGVDV